MAAIRRSISVVALLLGSFAGMCGCRPSFDWEGDWSGTRNLAIVPGTSPEVANSVKRVTLKVTDGEYELHASGIPSSGLFKTSGREATLQPVTRFNQAVTDSKAVTVKANEDGTITLSSPDSLDPGPIVLHRESQPPESNVRKQ